MSKAVLISIQPKWCELIASGRKTIEVRKTKPNIPTPFKCYIYQTKRTWIYNIYSKIADWQQKVIGEFVCDKIIPISVYYDNPNCYMARKEFPYVCMRDRDIINYLGNGKKGYGWHISDLKIYDKPKALNEFITPSRIGCCNEGKCKGCKWLDRGNGFDIEDDCFSPFDTDEYKPLRRPPQSWCYVEEIVSTACCENFDECAGCCHNTNCGYFDDLLRLGDKKAFEENCVGCCCGDGTLCNKNNGGCSNYEIKPIMG